jgi:hypothetical protein
MESTVTVKDLSIKTWCRLLSSFLFPPTKKSKNYSSVCLLCWQSGLTLGCHWVHSLSGGRGRWGGRRIWPGAEKRQAVGSTRSAHLSLSLCLSRNISLCPCAHATVPLQQSVFFWDSHLVPSPSPPPWAEGGGGACARWKSTGWLFKERCGGGEELQ